MTTDIKTTNQTSDLAASVNKALNGICRAKGCIEDYESFGDGDLRLARRLLDAVQKELEEALNVGQ